MNPIHDPEIESLLGAYVLDALDPAERERVEAYLAERPDARAEVDEMRETVASLATAPHDDVAASPELWQKIAAEIDEGAAVPAATPRDEIAERRNRRATLSTRFLAPIAVAAAIIAVVLAARVVSLNNDLDDATQPGVTASAAAFEAATETDGSQTFELTSEDGAAVARAVLLPDGSGYLVNDDLAPLPDDRTYQLWAATGDPANPTIVSEGVLGSDPEAVAFHVVGEVSQLMLTDEVAGGVVQPGGTPVASAAV